jgi:tripartite-type tricarboxylate transporter receptor subunit TctC
MKRQEREAMRSNLQVTARSIALAAGMLAGLAAGAQAQTDPAASYPNRIIKIVVGFAAGGGNDIIARIIGQRQGPLLKGEAGAVNRWL